MIYPLGISEIKAGPGQHIGQNRLPACSRRVDAGFHHNDLVVGAGKREAKSIALHTDASELRRCI